MDVNLH